MVEHASTPDRIISTEYARLLVNEQAENYVRAARAAYAEGNFASLKVYAETLAVMGMPQFAHDYAENYAARADKDRKDALLAIACREGYTPSYQVRAIDAAQERDLVQTHRCLLRAAMLDDEDAIFATAMLARNGQLTLNKNGPTQNIALAVKLYSKIMLSPACDFSMDAEHRTAAHLTSMVFNNEVPYKVKAAHRTAIKTALRHANCVSQNNYDG